MKLRALAGAALLIGAAAGVLAIFVFGSGGRSGSATALLPTATAPAVAPPTPTPFPLTWKQGLDHPTGDAILLSCFDGNRDGQLDGDDGPGFAALDIPLVAGEACVDPDHFRDFYAGASISAAGDPCAAARPPLLLVGIGSAGTDLYDTAAGESMGLLKTVNDLQAAALDEGVAVEVVLSAPAVFGSRHPQTNMAQWLSGYVRRRLEAIPCMRAVLIGHSHGAVDVTSVTAALDEEFGDRMFGILIDRTVALYDRNVAEYPERTPILNIFQLNEGWHGNRLDLPNIVDDDASLDRAPLASSDGGGGLALVSHKTLDDSQSVRHRIEAAVATWLAPHP